MLCLQTEFILFYSGPKEGFKWLNYIRVCLSCNLTRDVANEQSEQKVSESMEVGKRS